MYSRKGQAALEFLMTYGWAILVVLAAIGALAYFGILNPSNLLPDTCTPSSGFACPGKPIVNSTAVLLSVVSGVGADFTVNPVNVSFVSGSTALCTGGAVTKICDLGGSANCVTGAATSYTLRNGQGMTIILSGCTFPTTGSIKGVISFNYTNPQSLLVEKAVFNVNAKVPS